MPALIRMTKNSFSVRFGSQKNVIIAICMYFRIMKTDFMLLNKLIYILLFDNTSAFDE